MQSFACKTGKPFRQGGAPVSESDALAVLCHLEGKPLLPSQIGDRS